MTLSTANLLQLKPMHLPDAPSWWPIAWGWLSLFACALLVVIALFLVIHWRRRKMAPKKAALRIFVQTKAKMTPSDAIELVRQAALCYFPRDEIAKLTGKAWYEFLDTYSETPIFTPNETLWQQALYQKQNVVEAANLIDDCHHWIEAALPPKKRR